MLCPHCNDDLILHRANDRLIKYCPTCGYEGEEKRIPSRDRWVHNRRKNIKVIKGSL
jgi:Zn-finger nucleic acid-binding protein